MGLVPDLTQLKWGLSSVWQEKNCQMSIKVAQKLFQ